MRRHYCPVCGGSGFIPGRPGDWDDICLACEDDWCRLRTCSNAGLERHLAGDCWHARKAA